MKTLTYLASLALATATACPADTPSLKEALDQALFAETVTRDLPAAATAYANIVHSFSQDETLSDQRKYAATALFRLAELRNEQGREEEAKKHFLAFLDTFPDQEPQAHLAKVRLGISGPQPRQNLTPLTEDAEELSELLFRQRWTFSSRLKPDELLLTTFEVKHQEGYANEGLPPEFEVKTLHHVPSGQTDKWFSHTQLHWSPAELKERLETWKQETGKDTWRGNDRRHTISAFGQSYVVPEEWGLNYSGGGWGDASMAFFFTNKYSEKNPESGNYEEVDPTKWLTVKVSTRFMSKDGARKLVHPLDLKLPEMGEEAWSITLPPSPTSLTAKGTGE